MRGVSGQRLAGGGEWGMASQIPTVCGYFPDLYTSKALIEKVRFLKLLEGRGHLRFVLRMGHSGSWRTGGCRRSERRRTGLMAWTEEVRGREEVGGAGR